VGVGLLHRVHDSVAEVSRACAELARAVEDTRERIEEAERATPVWPTAPEPLPAAAEPVDQWIHEQATQRYLDDVAAYHRLCDRLQSVIDDAQDDLVAARHRFAAACEVATNHLLAPPSGPQWTWDRDMMARANTDLADAFATGDVQLINSHAQIAGSSYAMSTLTRGLWNAVTGTVETAADAVTGAANAVWDAFDSIGTGFGLGRPVDPEPHFEGIDITVDPAYPLDGANRAMTIAAELAWSVALAGGTKAAVDELLLRSDNRALLEMLSFMRSIRGDTGMYGLTPLTTRRADELGEIWVGVGYRVASDGRTMVSADGLRQYRPASWKKDLGFYQANFEWRTLPAGDWHNNGHAVIVDLP